MKILKFLTLIVHFDSSLTAQNILKSCKVYKGNYKWALSVAGDISPGTSFNFYLGKFEITIAVAIKRAADLPIT